MKKLAVGNIKWANFVAEAVIQGIRLASVNKLICGPFSASAFAFNQPIPLPLRFGEQAFN
jgi:hypothetical protein